MKITAVAVALLLTSCAADPRTGSTATASEPQGSAATTKPTTELPKSFGVYAESPGAHVALMGNPTIAGKDPTFLVNIENAPPIAKLRLRFGKSSAMMAIVNLKAGRDAGAFEATLAPVPGRDGVYRAVYSGTLEPASYIVYSLTDSSEGAVPWEKTEFQYVGQFSVK